jgi:RNA 2',3'-cyclic 3'-phosphodiesterase
MLSATATKRLFFALWPDDSTREALAHATRKAVRASGGRPVPPENLHSTLLFLGSVAVERLAELEAIGATIRLARFTLTLNQLEHWTKQALLCALSPTTPDEARALVQALGNAATSAGFSPDIKPFRPHVTLARKVFKPHAVGQMHPVVWLVDSFALVESETLEKGPRYTVLHRW